MNCLSAERYLLLRHDALPQHGAPEEAASRGVATLMSFTIRSDGVLPSLSTWRGMVPGGPAPAAPEQPEQPIAERAGASGRDERTQTETCWHSHLPWRCGRGLPAVRPP